MANAIRNLERNDWRALLAFEVANRAWFEQHIDPRAASFYTREGVQRHIEELVTGFAAGRCHPCVIVDDGGAIVGRANLKDIDGAKRCAEVGYRIAATHAGQGLATRALQHLMGLAREQWKLANLSAVVTIQNDASAIVLQKCGFVYISPMPAVAVVRGETVDGRLFECRGMNGS
jgi:[ribosomal protein S5]-alanine N-acetyltransferase